jgi:hypothetical protein
MPDRRESIKAALSPLPHRKPYSGRDLRDGDRGAGPLARAMTIEAVRAGKDVYVEKPVTHRMQEGEPLNKAVADSKHVVRTGMQQRSWTHFSRRARSWPAAASDT